MPFSLAHFRRMFEYSDAANRLVLEAAGGLDDTLIDREIDIGPSPGSLRRILVHTYNGERVWLSRWKGGEETKWLPEDVKPATAALLAAFEAVWVEREAWLATLDDARLDVMQRYRDSRGTLYRASLGDMLLQGFVHSTHHRAQAVNAVRRLGGKPPEVDYMVRVREKAE